MSGTILTLNAGSSSIKFAMFDAAPAADDGSSPAILRGQVAGLGGTPHLTAHGSGGETVADWALDGETADHRGALGAILGLLKARGSAGPVVAVGHRVVHGGPDHAAPLRLDTATIDALERLSPLAPLHQPHNIAGIRAAASAFPDALQVACFDTAFHRAHPWVNDTFALPRRFYERGVRRYGFHGLSYEYVTEALVRRAPEDAAGRVVVAHLGNGASMCAVRGGRSVGSTMGFTALDGLPMGTRCGQLDPGVVLYLLDEEKLTTAQVADLLYNRSGLVGLSGISHDMRTLEESPAPEARQAIEYFVFRIRRELGAMAAVLGGLDTLVFCGGIGENAWRVRAAVCDDQAWLGLTLNSARNRAGETEISSDGSRVRAYVIHTDEERMIARHTRRLLE